MGRFDILSGLLDRFGLTFSGKRNMASVLGYKPTLEYDDYLARYARGDIAGRIVEIPAEATWKTLPRLTGDEKLLAETALSKKFERLARKTHLRSMLEKADVLAGIGRYSVLLLGFADGKKLEEPVTEGAGGELLYLAPFSERSARPADIDVNPASPGFGRPSTYHIDLSRGVFENDPMLRTVFEPVFGQPIKANQKVHVSRIVHLAEGTLEDGLYGRPRLRRVWDRLDDMAKAVGGSAEIFWLTANRGMQLDVDKELALTPEAQADLEQQMEEYEHGLRRAFQTRGVNIKGLNELGAGNVNPRAVFECIAAIIDGATGIPYRMLFGTARGQNINAQDRRAWLEQVSSRQKGFATEVVLEPLIQKLVHAGVLPSVALDAELVWPPVHDDLHQAEVADTVARAEANHGKAVKDGAAVLTTGEFRSLYLGLPPEKPEDAADDAMAAERERREARQRKGARVVTGEGGKDDAIAA